MSQSSAQHGPINSAAINHLPFPGSETGKALVQLVGTVSVTGTITGISVRLTASAVSSGVASVATNPGILIKHQLGASAECGTSSRVSILGKIQFGAQGNATVAADVTPRLARSVSASTTAASQIANTGTLVTVPRAAAQPAVATASVVSVNETYRSAAALASADASVDALRKLIFSASTQGVVSPSISIANRHRVSAQTTAAASAASAISSVTLVFSASAVSAAQWNVFAGKKLIRSAIHPAIASAANIASQAIVSRSVSGSGVCTTASGISMRYFVSASAVATWAGYTVAFDFSVAPAPEDRQMVVPMDDRRMEVDQ